MKNNQKISIVVDEATMGLMSILSDRLGMTIEQFAQRCLKRQCLIDDSKLDEIERIMDNE